MAGAYGKYGVARFYALLFGIAYLAVALIEVIAGKDGLDPIFEFTPIQNAVHWAIGVIVLASFFGSEATAKTVARFIGVIFLVLSAWGLGSPGSFGDVLGYEGDIPDFYNVVHLFSAVVALYAGFGSRSVTESTA
ncbi:MAG TPA: DUF4383 domain-containing protein [Actinomycetota bacterium]|nr:DUF4383 domain-containing protein [Actinomycetota bacterium]